jgi:hypothetical protein
LLFALFLALETAENIVYALDNSFNALSADVSEVFFWGFPKLLFGGFYYLGAIFSNEFLVIDVVWACDSSLNDSCEVKIHLGGHYLVSLRYLFWLRILRVLVKGLKDQIKTSLVTEHVYYVKEEA